MYERKDAFYTRAKREGYRSRAAYKLEELAKQYKLFRPGARVVDLGAWPGGWMQVVAEAVGPAGCVIGVDLQPIAAISGALHAKGLQGDITDHKVLDRVIECAGGKVDVVLSDLSPKLSGIRDRDEANSIVLWQIALDVTHRILKPGGTLVVKLFMREATKPYLDQLRLQFREVRSTKPDATRKGSAELYAVAQGFKPPPASSAVL